MHTFIVTLVYLYCSIIKSIDSWLKSDPVHVVVVHCKVCFTSGPTLVTMTGFFRSDCKYEIEYEYDFSNLKSLPPCCFLGQETLP